MSSTHDQPTMAELGLVPMKFISGTSPGSTSAVAGPTASVPKKREDLWLRRRLVQATVYVRISDKHYSRQDGYLRSYKGRPGKWFRLLGLKADGRLIVKQRFRNGTRIVARSLLLDLMYGGCRVGDICQYPKHAMNFVLRAKSIARRLESLRRGLVTRNTTRAALRIRFPPRIGRDIGLLKRVLVDSPFRSVEGVWAWWYRQQRNLVWGSPYNFQVNRHPVLDHPQIVMAWQKHCIDVVNANVAVIMMHMFKYPDSRDVIFSKLMSYHPGTFRSRYNDRIFWGYNHWGVYMPKFNLIGRPVLGLLRLGRLGQVGPYSSVLEAFREIDRARTDMAIYCWPNPQRFLSR